MTIDYINNYCNTNRAHQGIAVWEDNKYLILLNFRRGKFQGISSGFNYFFSDLEDESFLDEELDWNPYPGAVNKYGQPAFNECFGYVPLLGLGGPEKAKNLIKVKLVEHIYLIKEQALTEIYSPLRPVFYMETVI